MKPTYARATAFLNVLICDITKIDAEIHVVHAKKMDFLPFEHAPFTTKGIEDLSLRATRFLELVIIFKISKDSEKHFIPTTVFHRCWKKQHANTISYVEKSKFTINELKFEITRRIKCIFEVSKFWWIIIKFLKLN